VGRPGTPPIGPLLAVAFDKAVGGTLRSWRWVLVFTSLSFLAALTVPRWASLLQGLLSSISWYFALAIAMRLVHPDFRMRARMAVRLTFTGCAWTFMIFLGLLAFVVPGIWVGVKLSLAPYVVALEDCLVSEGLGRSWKVTDDRFWQTALFNIVVNLAAGLVALVPGFIVSSTASFLNQVAGFKFDLPNVATTGFAIFFVLNFYANIAANIAYIYWYKELIRHEGRTLASGVSAMATPATPPASRLASC